MVEIDDGTYGWNSDMSISLLDKIRADLKTAMLGKNTEVRDTIRLIMGEFPSITVPITLESGKKTTRVKTPEKITNEDIHGIIRKFVKSEKMPFLPKKWRFSRPVRPIVYEARLKTFKG